MGWKLKGRQREEKEPEMFIIRFVYLKKSSYIGLPTSLVSYFEFSFSISPLHFDSCSSFFSLLKAERT